MPTVLNAANEIAVWAFMAGEIGFLDIARIVAETCEFAGSKDWQAPSSIEEALAIDEAVRQRTRERIPRVSSGAAR